MSMQLGEWENDKREEVYRRKDAGEVLYILKRTDTNQYPYEMPRSSGTHQTNHPHWGRYDIHWTDDIGMFFLIGGCYLTREDAEKKTLREGGCSCCGHGSKEIPLVVEEYIAPLKNRAKHDKEESK